MSAILIAFNYFSTWCTFNIFELVNWKFCVVVLTIYALYRNFKFQHLVKDVGDVGYDHLAGKKKFPPWTKKIRPEAVEGVRKRRHIGNIPPMYPNGWYILADSDEISTKQVKYISALGENFAIFRGEDGVINIVDAICPHLGANIGIGGKVSGNCIECPFHGWKFDGTNGECTSIPYSKTIPTDAKLKKWLSHETNKSIYVWYHAENEEPTWYPKTVPEIQNGIWRYGGRSEHCVNVHIQDVFENLVDDYHFYVVHGTVTMLKNKYLHFSTEFSKEEEKRHTFTARVKSEVKLFDYTCFNLVAENVCEGPGLVSVNLQYIFGSLLVYGAATPVEPLLLKVVIKLFYPFSASIFGYHIFSNMVYMMEGDIGIWNHKKYQNKPLLTKEEDKIKKYRRWFAQFYSKNSYKLQQNHFE